MQPQPVVDLSQSTPGLGDQAGADQLHALKVLSLGGSSLFRLCCRLAALHIRLPTAYRVAMLRSEFILGALWPIMWIGWIACPAVFPGRSDRQRFSNQHLITTTFLRFDGLLGGRVVTPSSLPPALHYLLFRPNWAKTW